MDALEYVFSAASGDSSKVLEFKPKCVMREDLMSLSRKFPLIPGSERSIKFCTTKLSQKVSLSYRFFIIPQSHEQNVLS